jgi:hypothetical protein
MAPVVKVELEVTQSRNKNLANIYTEERVESKI